jgi:short-subunit dehydrogenase
MNKNFTGLCHRHTKSGLNYLWLVAICTTLLTGSCATSRLSKAQTKQIAGKTYVITGASSGFGQGVALQLGKAGANVVLAARRKSLLDSIASRIENSGGHAIAIKTDVSDTADISRLADAAISRFGKVDVWINNAGVASIGRFWDIPLTEHERVIDVNLKGVFYGSYAAIKIFRAQGYGILINLGSVESEVPVAYQSSYSASKAAVRSLGEVLHQELRLSGDRDIHVVTIMPWAASTPFWQHLANHSGGTVTMLALDDPDKIVNAILRSSLHPRRRQLPVGWKAHAAIKTHRLFPYFTEWLSAQLAHKYQYKNGPAQPSSSGNLFNPVREGRSVYQEQP